MSSNGEVGGLIDIDKWVIGAWGTNFIIGLLIETPLGIIGESRRLEPVYMMNAGVQQVGPQQLAIQHAAQPMLFFPSFTSLEIPKDFIFKRCSELSTKDKATCIAAIKIGEKAATEIKLGQLGISQVPPGMQLPPPPGRRG